MNDQQGNYIYTDPQIVGFNSVEEQNAIYNEVLSFIDIEGKSILDIGCGRGDIINTLHQYLQGEIQFSYTGIEMNPLMCDIANELYVSQDNINFINSEFDSIDDSFLGSSDIVLHILTTRIPYQNIDIYDKFRSDVELSKKLTNSDGIIIFLIQNDTYNHDDGTTKYEISKIVDILKHEKFAIDNAALVGFSKIIIFN